MQINTIIYPSDWQQLKRLKILNIAEKWGGGVTGTLVSYQWGLNWFNHFGK